MTDLAVTQGSYRYYLNGDLADIDETWQCEPLPNGQSNVHSSRRIPGLRIDVQATVGALGVLACEVSWIEARKPLITASYKAEGDYIVFSRAGVALLVLIHC